jgi:chromosomal replication initiation ATPase DnaA
LARQLRLSLEQSPSYRREDFIVSDSNAEAVRLIEAWPAWPGPGIALVGSEGVGKTHLALGWAARTGAVQFDPGGAMDLPALTGRPILVENADSAIPGETLFHLMNMAAQHGGGLLLTARTVPLEWAAALPDLRSRLNALAVAHLAEPDDVILLGVVRKLFRERNIRPTDDTYPYLLRRMERSVAEARRLVEMLDEAADRLQRPVSRALAKEVLEAGEPTMDLF